MVKLPPANLVDRAIAWISPERGVARMRARAQMAVAGQWLGGSTQRTQTLNWQPFGGSPNTDMLVDRRFLRNRSRDLQRNNPVARGAVNTVVTSVAGTGLSLRARIDGKSLGITDEAAQAWQTTAEREFRLWADSPSGCDLERTLDFYGQQSLALRSCLESGDVFATLPMIPRKGSIYSLKIQLIEADRVVNKDYMLDTDTLFGGIRRTEFGEPLEYHMLKRHPGSMMAPQSADWDIIPAFGTKTGRRNVVHLFDKLRPGQARGMPYLAPVIETLKQLGDYTDGELRAALVASLFTVFVKAENGFGLEPDSSGAAQTSPAKTGDVMRMGSGAIIELNPGDDISTANPGRPNPSFDPFVQALLRQIGSALEIPFELLIKHFTSSYSASRAALLEAWRFFKGRRAWLAAMFCQPIYEAWMDEAVALGRITAPGYFDDPAIRAAYLRCEWIGDSQGQIDPLKEVTAAEKRLALLLSTFSDETVALSGMDWEDIVSRRSREEKVIDAAGLRAVLVDASNVAAPVDPMGPEEAMPGAPQSAPTPENN
jgi:lambda family phage portal protein